MAVIRQEPNTSWRSYHDTATRASPDRRSLVAAADTTEDAGEYFAATATALRGLLREAQMRQQMVQTLGSAWSFSNLIDSDGPSPAGDSILLETHPAMAIFEVPASAQASAFDPHLVLTSGGTKISELNAWLAKHSLSLVTSGAHDGQSVAGACATGIHGSVVARGGFQNHVRGIHLVTGPDESVWLERGPGPIINDAFAGRFASCILRDPQAFDAAVVHLGGLGIVNAVLLEAADDYGVAVVRRRHVWNDDFNALLAAGSFLEFARVIWPDCDVQFPQEPPYYVEAILNPFATVAPVIPGLSVPRPALITMFWKTAAPAAIESPERLEDGLNLLAKFLGTRLETKGDLAAEKISELLGMLMPPPWAVADAIRLMFRQEPDGGATPRVLRWGQANGHHKKLPVDIHNAAFALQRDQLPIALRVMQEAFLQHGRDQAGGLVFTLRFVSDAAGLLAFQRFPHTVVVNMDGLRSGAAVRSAADVALALEAAGIEFSQHWGKQGVITPNRFRREYGDPAGTAGPLNPAATWKQAREQLLAPSMRPLVGNSALAAWGLM